MVHTLFATWHLRMEGDYHVVTIKGKHLMNVVDLFDPPASSFRWRNHTVVGLKTCTLCGSIQKKGWEWKSQVLYIPGGWHIFLSIKGIQIHSKIGRKLGSFAWQNHRLNQQQQRPVHCVQKWGGQCQFHPTEMAKSIIAHPQSNLFPYPTRTVRRVSFTGVILL